MKKRRAAINSLSIDPTNANQIIVEQVIPENEGGFWLREIGLYDDDDNLIAVANCPETYKPQLQEGSGRVQTVRMILAVSQVDAVSLKIDPAVVLASRQYVDDKALSSQTYTDTKVTEVKSYTDNGLAAHIAAVNPHKQYAPIESPVFTGNPTAPTASAGANNRQLATTAFVKGAIEALVASSPATLSTLNELAAALGNDPNFATTITNALAGKQPLDNTLTALSGKSVAALLEYLGLRGAATKSVGTEPGQLPTTSDADNRYRMKVWVSEGQTPATNTPVIVSHGLNIDPDLCISSVRLRCVTANNGYNPGDLAVGFGQRSIVDGVNNASAVMIGTNGILLTSTHAQWNVGTAGLMLSLKNSGGYIGLNSAGAFAQWAIEFVIKYQEKIS
ncbi:hypothetical protein OS42_23830 [Dickeya oryzae]